MKKTPQWLVGGRVCGSCRRSVWWGSQRRFCAAGLARAGHGVPCCDFATSHASFLPLPRAAARVTLKALTALADAIVGRSSAAVQHGVGAWCRLAAQPQYTRRRFADEVGSQARGAACLAAAHFCGGCCSSAALPPSCNCPARSRVRVCCREAPLNPRCPPALLLPDHAAR